MNLKVTSMHESRRLQLIVCYGLTAYLLLAHSTSFTLEPPRSTGPRLKVSGEIFDFGCVPQDAMVSHTFWLRNTGTETVKIDKLQPNCGCTQAPLTDSIIKVGDSLPVEIIFGTRNLVGKIEKFTRIVSNAQGRVPALTIRAEVPKADAPPLSIEFQPAQVAIANDQKDAVVQCRNTASTPIILTVVDAPLGHISLNYKVIEIGPNSTREIVLQVNAPEKTNLQKSVTFEASDERKTRLTVPVGSTQAKAVNPG